MLKRGLEMLAGVALSVAILAVLPGVAEAQGTNHHNASADGSAERLVVAPGECLWSISEERLGPNATPQQIAREVELIYALNRNTIGADPDLIFVGQRLSLPQVVAERQAGEAPSGAMPAREAAEPAEASPRGPVPEKKAPKTLSDTQTEPVALPELPLGEATPKVGSLSATDNPSPVESFGRKQLGLGIIVLTLLVVALLTWKVPLKRNVGGSKVRWIPGGYPRGIPRGYAAYIRPGEAADHDEGTPGSAIALPPAPAAENPLNSTGLIVAKRGRRERLLRVRARSSGRLPGGGVATGTHNPQFSRYLRCARHRAYQTVWGSPWIRPVPHE